MTRDRVAFTAPARPDPWRNLRAILSHNVPLIALLLAFDFWRVLINQGTPGCSTFDFVCSLTERYGDSLPIVSSFTNEATKYTSQVNVQLLRELLFFNFVIWLVYLPTGILVFFRSASRLGLGKIVDTRKFGLPLPGILLVGLFCATIAQNVGDVPSIDKNPRDAIYSHWTGVLKYNANTVLSSALSMMILVFVFDVRAAKSRKTRE